MAPRARRRDTTKWVLLVGASPLQQWIVRMKSQDTGLRSTEAVFFEPVMLYLMFLVSNVDTVEASRFRGSYASGKGTPVGWTLR